MKTCFAAVAFAASIATSAYAAPAGYSPLAIDAPHHGKEMLGAVFFPNGGGGRQFTFADNPVFEGVEVVEEGAVLEGSHPVVLLSHGMGGNIRSMAWLATALAERGAIVVSVNHPNTTWGDFDMKAGMNHWTRAQDLSVALDTLLADPRFAGHVDESNIMAAGFSYGGWTALSMGGVRSNLAGYLANCDVMKGITGHCEDLLKAGVSATYAADWERSYADPRVTQVVAIEPGFVWGLDAEDVTSAVSDIRLIGMGENEDRMVATDFDASGLADLLPLAKIDRVVPGVHFTMMPLCKPLGAAILKEEQDDPVCTDPEGTDRAAAHALVVDRIAGDLGL